MDIVYNVSNSVGQKIKQLPTELAIEALQVASKKFMDTTTKARRDAVKSLRNHAPSQAKMTAVETVQKMRGTYEK